MASDRDVDSASAAAAAAASVSGQSKRPPLNHRMSDYSDISAAAQPRSKHQKQRHVGRVHARVPSNKGLQKQHQQALAAAKLNQSRKPQSPIDAESPQLPDRPSPQRRATSELRLTSQSSSTNLPKISSHTNLKRNRSHVEVSKRNRSSDKLKHSASGTAFHRLTKSTKSQVHFDLGNDDDEQEVDEDEWVDASGSNSPYLSRKGSLNSSAQSSFRPGGSAANSRPHTPNHPTLPQLTSPERRTVQHKEYLTSRLLQRTPSHGAPPKMTADIARATASQLSLNSTEHEPSPQNGSHEDELTSRFVEVPGSGVTSEGSFYNTARAASLRSDDIPRRPHSMANLSQSHDHVDRAQLTGADDSALVPKSARRTAAPTAETSRIQQKLNLQRASSSIEPSQTVTGAGGAVGANPLIGVGDPGYDGGNSRDPRVGKLLERTGMEYLVVRRCQNPIARSLTRLGQLPGMDKTRRIPRTGTASTTTSKRSVELPVRHVRNVSMPDSRPTASSKQVATVRMNGTGSSFEGDDMSRLHERLSGSSLVGTEEEDGTATLLRNLWEKSMELSASTD